VYTHGDEQSENCTVVNHWWIFSVLAQGLACALVRRWGSVLMDHLYSLMAQVVCLLNFWCWLLVQRNVFHAQPSDISRKKKNVPLDLSRVLRTF
jgi:hypothetical protein